ncbi:MAG: YbhN family protein [Desulfatitalea sp.]
MKTLRLKRLVPLLMLTVFLLALWSVYRQLQGYHWHDLLTQIRQMPAGQAGTALLLTLSSYLVMTAYDLLALTYIRHPLPFGKTALASGLGYAFSNNVGFSMLAGASIRYRIYSAWGLSALEITQVVLFCSASLWLGFVGLSAIVFLIEPLALPQGLHLPFATVRPLGVLLLFVLLGYAGVTLFSKKNIAVKGWPPCRPGRWPPDNCWWPPRIGFWPALCCMYSGRDRPSSPWDTSWPSSWWPNSADWPARCLADWVSLNPSCCCWPRRRSPCRGSWAP